MDDAPPGSGVPLAPLVRLGSAAGRGPQVLLVEDDAATADVIAAGLALYGHTVEVVSTLRQARRFLKSSDPIDLVLVDVGLPDGSGLDLCVELCARDQLPVIVVSSAGTAEERIRGFDVGADDYVVKPVNVLELARRVEAVLRRSGFRAVDSLVEDPSGLDLDVRRGEATFQGQLVSLTRSETGILRVLLEQPGQAVPLDEICQRVWNYQALGDANFVHQHLSRLRRKLRLIGFSDEAIRTIYGVGYAFESSPHVAVTPPPTAETIPPQ